MINQQLLEYIKKQLGAGVARDEIERTLTSGGGWVKSDVDEAFAGIVPVKSEIPIPVQNNPVEPYFNKPLEPYIQTSQVIANNNLSSQQNVVVSIQPNLSGNILKSSIDLLKESFSIYKNKFRSFMFALSPLILVAILLPLATSISPDYIFFTFPIFIIISFILLPLSLSYILFVMANREKELSFSEIINGGFGKLLSLIWIIIISLVIISAGSVLFFIPGLIFSVWFSFPLSILFAEDKKGMDAMLLSKEYVKGYWGSLAWRIFSFVLLIAVLTFILFAPIYFIGGLLGINTSFLGSLFDILLLPISFIYSYLLYENIKGIKSGAVLQIGSKTPFIIVAILGGLFIPLMIFGSIAFGLFNLFKSADVNVDNFSNININTSDNNGGTTITPTTNEPEQAVSLVNNVIDTSDWKTYKNDKYGFEIQYPMIVMPDGSKVGGVTGGGHYGGGIQANGETQFAVQYQSETNQTGPSEGYVIFSAMPVASAPKSNADELYSYYQQTYGSKGYIVKKFNVTGGDGVMYYLYTPGSIGGGPESCSMNVEVFSGNSFYTLPPASALIYAPEAVGQNCTEYIRSNFNSDYTKVLSTLKFTTIND